MPTITARVECPVNKTFRVQQLSGMFDVPLEQKVGHEFSVELPGAEEDWRIGVIVGPSGSGKTTIARQAYGDCLYEGNAAWPEDKAVVEGFPDNLSIKQITATLTAVGFSTPPDWVKPYRALSNGQKFRVDLARALLSEKQPVAFDEFTSVVDRRVAQIGSAAVAKSIRGGKLNSRFVAVTCHYDIIDWLEPDWTLDMSTQQLARGCLHRPPIELEIFRCHHSAWKLFKAHHYLDSGLHTSSQCYLATWNGEPVAFCAMLYVMGYKDYWRVSRIVTLPDYQGVGIGTRLMEWCCQKYLEQGAKRISLTASHPAIIRHCEKSPLWGVEALKLSGNKKHGKTPDHKKPAIVSAGRAVAVFVFRGASSMA